jgi:hypothetical protein
MPQRERAADFARLAPDDLVQALLMSSRKWMLSNG